MIFSNTIRNRLQELNASHEKRFVTELTIFQEKQIRSRSYCDEIDSIYGYTFQVLGSHAYDLATKKGVLTSPLEKDLENMTNLADALHEYYTSTPISEMRALFNYTPKQQALIDLADSTTIQSFGYVPDDLVHSLLINVRYDEFASFEQEELIALLGYVTLHERTNTNRKYGSVTNMLFVQGVPVGIYTQHGKWLAGYSLYPFNAACLNYIEQSVLSCLEPSAADDIDLNPFLTDKLLSDPDWFSDIKYLLENPSKFPIIIDEDNEE